MSRCSRILTAVVDEVETLFACSCHMGVLFVGRNDEKTAADYKVTGGSVLHLVLALRGGLTLSVC